MDKCHGVGPVTAAKMNRLGIHGGLAATLALLARDRKGPAIRFQHLTYPMLDDRTVTDPDSNPFTGEYMWTRAYNRFAWSSLLGHAAAARAPDLAGLPPAFLAVGGLDLFLEENLAYARRLTRAGVPVGLHLYPGALHGFEMVADARVSHKRSGSVMKHCCVVWRHRGNPAASHHRQNIYLSAAATVPQTLVCGMVGKRFIRDTRG